MELKHVALYAKGHYRRSDNIWEDLRACLEPNGFIECEKEDIVVLITNAVSPLIALRWPTKQLMNNFINEIRPHNVWRFGYRTKDYPFAKEEEKKDYPDYDYDEAIVRYYLSELVSQKVTDLGGLPLPSKKVLPLRRNLSSHAKVALS
jgi:hypothetical protein